MNVCFSTAPTGLIMLPATVDTGMDGSCTLVATQKGGPDLCVIAGNTVEVSGTTVAIGTRPLVLIAADTVRVSGTLDASSRRSSGGRTGAGANSSLCTAAGAGKNDAGGGGGGAGGSLGTAGGKGGLGDMNNNGPPTGSATGGTPGAAQMPPAVLRGGCAGGAGGVGLDTADPKLSGGAGGAGGGAVYLIAGNVVEISGNVFASGAGGSVANGNAGFEQGAGGGGSGGMIGLDAPAIQVSGHVAANGGAGAGGGADQGGTGGGDGTTTSWNMRAQAGQGDFNQPGSGGDGAAGTAAGGTDQLDGHDAAAAGGGAAGGLGIVWVDGALTGTMISPAPAPHP